MFRYSNKTSFVRSAPLVSIARACGRSGGHQGYAIEPSYPKGGTGGFLSKKYVFYNQINFKSSILTKFVRSAPLVSIARACGRSGGHPFRPDALRGNQRFSKSLRDSKSLILSFSGAAAARQKQYQ